jgi:SAM-dependent methyltransferase
VATDIQQIVANLHAFYDFAGRTVVAVGAGGGQLIEYARPARRVIAVDVDQDKTGIERLAARVLECGLADRYTLVKDDFLTVQPCGDVVLFEFCLHEMADPERALRHAGDLAADVLVIDPTPPPHLGRGTPLRKAKWRQAGRRSSEDQFAGAKTSERFSISTTTQSSRPSSPLKDRQA